MVAAETLGPFGRAAAPVLAAPAEVTAAPEPSFLAFRAVGVAAVVPVDGEVSAAEAGAPRATHAIPRAPAAGPDVATAVVLARLADPSGPAKAAATKGGVGRVLEVVRGATAAGPATGPSPPSRGVGQGRVATAQGTRTAVAPLGPSGPTRVMAVVHAEAAAGRVKHPNGPVLATAPGTAA